MLNNNYLIMVLDSLSLMIFLLMSTAFLTLSERKVLGRIQLRKGPNKIGFKGMMQSLSDALKLIAKEWFFFNYSVMFVISPVIMLMLSFFLWLIYPWLNINDFCEYDYSIIYIFFKMSLMVFPIFLIGWFSNNNYSILGSLRAIAQMISFEISMFFMLFIIMMLIEGFSLKLLHQNQMKIHFNLLTFPLYLIFFLSMLIDLNRIPFDLIEGESELVSGFNVEYHSVMFTLIFLSEYMNVLFSSLFLTLVFFNFECWTITFYMIFLFHVVLLLWIRGLMPRIRFDQLMMFCWTDLLIFVMMYLIFVFLIKKISVLLINF